MKHRGIFQKTVLLQGPILIVTAALIWCTSLPVRALQQNTESENTALLAGGCFWGIEELMRQLPGVKSTETGYTGGFTPNATYNLVKKGTSGHAEAVRIKFDPDKTSYEKILEYFFKIHDPTTLNRQGNDVGSQYRSAIFFLSDKQRKIAQNVLARVQKNGFWKKKVVTEIVPATQFFRAEEYHQKYLVKNPGGYTCHFERPVSFSK